MATKDRNTKILFLGGVHVVQLNLVTILHLYGSSSDACTRQIWSHCSKGQVQPKSAMAADIVPIGYSWLCYAIHKGLLEPVKNAEQQDWFRSLSDRWKANIDDKNNRELQRTYYQSRVRFSQPPTLLRIPNDFDINLTVDMLAELSSQDMLHDDAEDINDLHDGQGLPGDDYHHTEVSESSSNPNQDLQNEKSATTSDVKSVLPKFSNINLLDNDLGLPNDDKSAGASTTK